MSGDFYKKSRRERYDVRGDVVGVARLELAASWSRTMRATICATPRDSFIIIMSFRPVVKELFHFLHIFGLVQIYCQHEDEIWLQL